MNSRRTPSSLLLERCLWHRTRLTVFGRDKPLNLERDSRIEGNVVSGEHKKAVSCGESLRRCLREQAFAVQKNDTALIGFLGFEVRLGCGIERFDKSDIFQGNKSSPQSDNGFHSILR